MVKTAYMRAREQNVPTNILCPMPFPPQFATAWDKSTLCWFAHSRT